MSQIIQAIYRNAQLNPNQVALSGFDAANNATSVTYRQLVDKLENTANSIKHLGGQCIALRAENSIDWAIVDLAAMMVETPLVPIPTFFSNQQIEHVLTSTGADILVGDWNDQFDRQDSVCHLEGLPAYRIYTEPCGALLEGTVKVTFTSGSTGTPKGVCLSEDNLFRVSSSLVAALDVDVARHLVLLPLSTLLENVTGVYVPLILGVTSMIFPGEHVGLTGSSKFNAQDFSQALAQYQPNSLVLTPALLMALIQVVKHNTQLGEPLRFVAVGGARVAPEIMEMAHQLGIPAYEGYGLSESASVVSLNAPNHVKHGSCGAALEHIEVQVAKDNELLIKGNIALGYLNEPFTDEWLATGDLVNIDQDGFIHIHGRKKNQIITSYGRNVSPEWIESQAQVFMPGVKLLVVGEAQHSLSAIVEPTDYIVERISLLNESLPDYARIQRLILTSNLATHAHWFTENGRPKRDVIETWASELISGRYTNTDHQIIELY
ncbi:AMP-binding protein [Vibrio hepatarius]|uniref:AMP-binding protein n=1 Tax=Vibrio hepatarius TaxID=171383 RepID=UPI00142D50E9|nr:AMP-binding protein [Vibrio hepatarius]NIY82620.1 long-chain fatty acid--CoA ligase [Vibrio hepatarius]